MPIPEISIRNMNIFSTLEISCIGLHARTFINRSEALTLTADYSILSGAVFFVASLRGLPNEP